MALSFPCSRNRASRSIKANPLFGELISRTGQAPQWNFHKYLVDRDGNRVTSFGTRIEPQSAELTSALERLLSEKTASPKS